MVAHGDHLFVAAGNTNAGDRRDVMTTEMYDIGCDSWTTLSPSLHGQSEAPAVQCDSRIYILGGYSWDAHSFQVTASSFLTVVFRVLGVESRFKSSIVRCLKVW